MLLCHRTGPGHFLLRPVQSSRRPFVQIPLACAECVPRAERGRRKAGVALPPSQPLPIPVEKGSQIALSEWALPVSSGLCEIEEFASPTSPPNLVRLLIRSRSEKQKQEETLQHAAARPLGQVCDDQTPFAPLFPLKNASRPPAGRPSPTTAGRGKHRPRGRPKRREPAFRDPHESRDSVFGRSLTHQNAHLFLAKEAGEEGGDGEAHGGSGTCDGQEQKGFRASPGLLLPSSRQTEREKEAKEERRRQELPASWRFGLSSRSGTSGARTCSTTGAAAPALVLRLSLCHVTRQPRRLQRRPGPSNADRIASPPPHPPALPVLSMPLRLRTERIGRLR